MLYNAIKKTIKQKTKRVIITEQITLSNITLKDIAEQAGVSMVTVHRALAGKPGVSEEKREAILKVAERLGYTGNAAASALKKKRPVVAVVLPEGDRYGAYYFKYMWKGVLAYREDAVLSPAKYLDFPFEVGGNPEREEECQVRALKEVLDQYGDQLDGLLAAPIVNTSAVQEILEEYIAKGVRVVLIDDDFPQTGRLCCVAPNDENTGRLSAELMCEMIHQQEGTILIGAGSRKSLSHRMNAMGFSDYVRTHRPDLKMITLNDDSSHPDSELFYQAMCTGNVTAAYSVRGRNTIPLCEAALKLESERKLLLLGSDLFDRSAEMLRRGVLKGIIYKNPYEKGRTGMKILTENLTMDKIPASEKIAVPISVILRNNLTFFEQFI